MFFVDKSIQIAEKPNRLWNKKYLNFVLQRQMLSTYFPLGFVFSFIRISGICSTWDSILAGSGRTASRQFIESGMAADCQQNT